MKKGSKFFIFTVLALISIFFISYMATDLYLKSKSGDDTDQASTSADSNNSKYLSKDIKVILSKNGNKESEKTLDDVIDEYGLEGNVTKEELTEALKEYGYKYDVSTQSEIYYNRDAKDGLTPNKYYIGEYEGYLAIYKANSKGVLEIEDEKEDIYRDRSKFKDLKPLDQDAIKKYEYVYDTKEEAKLDMSGLN